MAKNGRCSSDAVAQRILAVCRVTDADANLLYVGRGEDGEVVVRVGAGVSSSAAALQRDIAHALPLARVRTSESVLDGQLAAIVTVPSPAGEWQEALRLVAARPAFAMFRVCAWGFFLLGLGALASRID